MRGGGGMYSTAKAIYEGGRKGEEDQAGKGQWIDGTVAGIYI